MPRPPRLVPSFEPNWIQLGDLDRPVLSSTPQQTFGQTVPRPPATPPRPIAAARAASPDHVAVFERHVRRVARHEADYRRLQWAESQPRVVWLPTAKVTAVQIGLLPPHHPYASLPAWHFLPGRGPEGMAGVVIPDTPIGGCPFERLRRRELQRGVAWIPIRQMTASGIGLLPGDHPFAHWPAVDFLPERGPDGRVGIPMKLEQERLQHPTA